MDDVVVTISDQTRPLTQDGFGKILILGDTKIITGAKDTYKEYAELTDVLADYEDDTAEYKAANAVLSQEPRPETVAIFNVTRADNPIASELTNALNTIITSHNDWYYIIITSRKTEDIDAVAEWVDQHEKLFGICVGSTDDTTPPSAIVTLAEQLASERCFILAHKQPDCFGDAAWVGEMATMVPGSATWKFKNLIGIEDAGYNTTEIQTLTAGFVNTYIKKFGILQTTEGMTTKGTYIDITQIKDWLKAKMQEAVMAVFAANKKVPYDDTGISLVVGAVNSVLKQAGKNGAIAKDESGNYIFTVTAPKRADIPAEDRAKRKLPDIKWNTTISGAVHNVNISGVVRV